MHGSVFNFEVVAIHSHSSATTWSKRTAKEIVVAACVRVLVRTADNNGEPGNKNTQRGQADRLYHAMGAITAICCFAVLLTCTLHLRNHMALGVFWARPAGMPLSMQVCSSFTCAKMPRGFFLFCYGKIYSSSCLRWNSVEGGGL